MNSIKKQLGILSLLAVVSYAYAQACFIIGNDIPCVQNESICYGPLLTLPSGETMWPVGTIISVFGTIKSCIPYPFGDDNCQNNAASISCTFNCYVPAEEWGQEGETYTFTFNTNTAKLSSVLCSQE